MSPLRNLDRHLRRLREKVDEIDVPDEWAEVAGRFVSEREAALTPAQRAVYADESRFRVVVAGRRFGKTYEAVTELVVRGVRDAGSVCWLVAPTHQMAREIAWPELKGMVDPRLVDGSPNETYLTMQLQNGSEIGLRSADKPDSLRGRGLDFLVVDEAARVDEDAWTEVLRPALSDREGEALFISTPAGYNWIYDLHLDALDSEGWSAHEFTTLEGGQVADEEVEAARASLDPRTFSQEYEASFEHLAGRVYSNFSKKHVPHGNVDPEIENEGAELLVGVDFNVHPMSAVVAQRAADECEVLDSIEIPTSNTREMASELRARYGTQKIVCYPDPSGKARRTSAPVGQTDFSILRDAGFKVRAPSRAPLVVDRVNAVQALLLNAEGRRRLRIHPDASELVKALMGLTYREGTSQPDKTSGLDHICDALGYLVWSEFNTVRDRTAKVVPGPWSHGNTWERAR